jgi:hypothetical protein
VKKNLATALIAATLSLGGVTACAQPQAPKESSKETKMENPAIAEADKAAQAAEEAANRADQQKPQSHPQRADQEKTSPEATIIPAMPWATMQRRIETLIAGVKVPEDTHPDRVKAMLLVDLANTREGDWEAEGTFDEGFEYAISVSERGEEELGTGHDIYIYFMPPKINDAPVSTDGSTLCTWSMNDLSKLILQNGYEKGIEQRLAKEDWEFHDLTSNKTYNRYLSTLVYRMKDDSEHGMPCLSRIHLSTGYKEEKQ